MTTGSSDERTAYRNLYRVQKSKDLAINPVRSINYILIRGELSSPLKKEEMPAQRPCFQRIISHLELNIQSTIFRVLSHLAEFL
mmetsp:Transcript_1163/g.2675  ORF Transcript_1163/g.2675 Transcript_1163/m.2675 type:complete len:84 (+) Transcript_1163:190-441(+)